MNNWRFTLFIHDHLPETIIDSPRKTHSKNSTSRIVWHTKKKQPQVSHHVVDGASIWFHSEVSFMWRPVRQNQRGGKLHLVRSFHYEEGLIHFDTWMSKWWKCDLFWVGHCCMKGSGFHRPKKMIFFHHIHGWLRNGFPFHGLEKVDVVSLDREHASGAVLPLHKPLASDVKHVIHCLVDDGILTEWVLKNFKEKDRGVYIYHVCIYMPYTYITNN